MPSSRPGRPALVLLSAAALLATPLAVLGGTPASAGAPPAAAAEPQDVASSGPLRLQNSFVSDVGWVKPGEAYPSRLLVTNTGSTPLTGVQVTASAPAGTDFVSASGAAVTPSSLTWSVGTLAAGATRTLVVHAEADTPAEDPRVVWKNIASNATASATGVAPTAPARSHGPKVIPATAGHDYDSARFGDRPFPVVPVEYADRKFNGGTQANPLPTGGAGPNTAEALAKAINDPANPGSTFNLYQEMSYGQLFPKGTVPALGKTEAYSSGKPVKTFTTPAPAGLCTGVTTGPLPPQGMRVVDGKYQLPGTTGYYGSDKYAKGYTAQAGVPLPVDDIDGGCGPTAKLVYDAAVIADPDIDYSDYDTDKDGVVDFFMAVFAGCGGNGGSQLAAIACPDSLSGSYDNVWPHSSSLEDTYTDAATGLRGYVSQDQLKDLEGRPLWYADAGRSTTTPVPGPDSLKVFVRVGPYNVNPETAIDKASVISHEYGHSLGLPDFYSTSSRETYGDWNLMATDKSQFMDVYSRQRLGWVVPDVIGKGSDVEVTVRDGKEDVQRIDWVQPDGAPYSLSPANGDQGIHNGQAFVAKLPGRPLLDEKVLTPAQGSRLWFSGAGNDFGCSPLKGHNLDIALPGAERLPAGSKITATFDSAWNIEWDYDYGFVLAGARPGGKQTLVSQPSDKNYTTPKALNPNNNGCLAALDNGLTGSSASYAKDPVQAQLDRVNAALPPAQFVQDSYTLDELAGQPGAFLRFSYATDPGFAGQGWFIDNLKVVATPPSGPAVTLFDNGFEDPATGGPEGAQVWNGSCKDSLRLSDVCTAGWNHVSRGGLNTLDHAYYLEMRDRSGFDFEGRGEDDRDPIGFQPGLSLVYADEAHGDGNAGTDDPPAQHPLDAVPQPGEEAPTLDDAAFTAEAARSRFTDTPDPVTGRGRYDNYTDPTRPKDKTDTALSPWEFDYSCLTLTVLSMSGNVANNDKLPFEAGADVLTGRVHLTGGPGCATLDTRSVVPTTASPSASPSVSPSATAAAPGSSATPAASPSASSSPTPAAPGGGGVPAPSSSPTASGSPSPSAPASAGPTGSASAPAPAATTVCGVPAPVQVARSTIVSGDAVTAQLTGSPGALVDLVAYTRPSTTYRTVRSVRLAGDGTATARLLPPSNTRMYAQERGCAAGPSSVVTVKASVSLDARRTGPRTYAFSGNSLPKRAGGMPVLLYRRDAGGREVLVSRTRTDGRTGTWTLRRTFTGTGRLALVARIPQDASNAAGVSAVRTVTVR